jgi:type I restriction enzyme S subunit
MPVAINQGFIEMKCNKRASNYFMLNWCRSSMTEIENRASGTTFAEISKQNFRPIPLVIPSKWLMEKFTSAVTPLYTQIVLNVHESRTLVSLRNALLPKLLNGDVRLRLQGAVSAELASA